MGPEGCRRGQPLNFPRRGNVFGLALRYRYKRELHKEPRVLTPRGRVTLPSLRYARADILYFVCKRTGTVGLWLLVGKKTADGPNNPPDESTPST